MAKLPEVFNFADIVKDENNITIEELTRIVSRLYTDLAVALNRKPDVYQRDVDGQVSDSFLSNGDININLTTDKVEMLTNHTGVSAVSWITLG